MNYEVGIQFGLKGANQVASELQNVSNKVENVHETVEKTSGQFGSRFKGMAENVRSMSRSVVGSITAAKVAIAGFVGEKIVHGMGSFLKQQEELGKNQDFLRLYGASEEIMKKYGETAHELNSKLAGFSKADWFSSMFNVQSLHADEGIAKLKEVGKAVGYLGTLLKSSSQEASDYYKTLQQAYYAHLPEGKKATFHEDVLGKTYQLMKTTATVPHDVMMAVKQAGSIYAMTNRPMEELFASIATVTPRMGAERGGTALRMLAGRSGESYAKLNEAVQSIRYERMLGRRIEDMTEQQQKRFKLGKFWDEQKAKREGGELFTRNPEEYWKKIGSMMQTIKKDGGDWLGKLAEHGFGQEAFQAGMLMAQDISSGEFQKKVKEFQASHGKDVYEYVDKSFNSAASKLQLLHQEAHALHQTIARSFDPIYTGVLDSLKETLMRAGLLWEEHGTQISTNFGYVWQGFKESITEAFKGTGGIEHAIGRIVNALSSGNPEQWIELGRSFGTYLAPRLNAIVSGFEAIAAACEKIIGADKSIQNISKADFAQTEKKKKEATPPSFLGWALGTSNAPWWMHPAEGLAGAWAASKIGNIFGLSRLGGYGFLAGTSYSYGREMAARYGQFVPEGTPQKSLFTEAGRALEPALEWGLSTASSGLSWLGELLREGIGSRLGAGQQETSVNATIEPQQITIEMDGDKVAEKVTDRVEQRLDARNANKHGVSNDYYPEGSLF